MGVVDNNQLARYIAYSFQHMHLKELYCQIKEWRKKTIIPLFSLLKIFFFIPVFSLKSFLQADLLFRLPKYRKFFQLDLKGKRRTSVSDSHMSNILKKLPTNDLRNILYETFKQAEPKIERIKGLRVGIVDGTVLSKQYSCVFEFYSKSTPFVLDIQKTKGKGNELRGSERLLKKVTKRLGRDFADIILYDGLYRYEAVAETKKITGANTLFKTTQKNLEFVQEIDNWLGSELWETHLKKAEGFEVGRMEKYEIYQMNYTYDKEELLACKVIETKSKPRKNENPVSEYYVMTNQMDLTPKEMREFAIRRWNIENNGFKSFSDYAASKHLYSKDPEVVEKLMLIFFLSFNLMNLFMNQEEVKEYFRKMLGKAKMSKRFMRKRIGALLEYCREEVFSP